MTVLMTGAFLKLRRLIWYECGDAIEFADEVDFGVVCGGIGVCGWGDGVGGGDGRAED